MKLNKIMVLGIILMLAAPTAVMSQSFSRESKSVFGVKGGFNIATQLFSDDFSQNDLDEFYVWTPAFHLGFSGEKYISRLFSIETDLLFSTKGHRYIEETDDYTINNKRIVNYLELPIQFKANQKFGDDSKAYFAAGPYLATAIGGYWKFDEYYSWLPDDHEANTPITDKLEFGENTSVYRRIDWGVQINAGVEFGALQVSVGYQWGIYNVDANAGDANGSRHNNRVAKVSLGYRIVR